MSTQNEIRTRITNEIVAALEGNALPIWRKPWRDDPNAGFPCNAVSHRRYSGVNPIIMQVAAHRHGLQSRFWATFRQWEQLGGRVKKRPADVPSGQWGTQIVFCKPVVRKDTNEGGEETEDKFFVLRTFTVFNVDQVDGPFDHLRVGHAPLPACEVQRRYEHADAVFEATGARVEYGGDRAYYDIAADRIHMPYRSQFALPEFYETLFHEAVHWTEHPGRLNWDRGRPGNTYALGELVAELGGVYMAGELGLPTGENLTNHAAYLRHWLDGMKKDARFLFTAAAQASRAVDYLLSFSRPAETVPEPEEAVAA